MKAYLVTTGTLFGLLAAMHPVLGEKWHLLTAIICLSVDAVWVLFFQ